ncbi:hypothetical protein [Beggiatoa leptomitoformis]|uniref:Uncharacterized protein n=1 Tax=Beggiatoa leptomitoformis TaxID=288004 RepID=A0A2N9YAQ9_9GAMM|nr:hypothetical protein [Beggiatoa leptomitoformis]ALG67080.1 hypothetical protein AL038_04320 [Beggiatoa leptomitoformis]AUI67529.1 hypothetical protein BLE401_01685 [Beggiatoa leptomitoformis]
MNKNYYSLSLLAFLTLLTGCDGLPSVNDKPMIALVPSKSPAYAMASTGFTAQSTYTRTLNTTTDWQEEQTIQALFRQNDIDALTRYLERNVNNSDKYAYVQRVWTERDTRCKKIAQTYTNSPKNETILNSLENRYQYSCPQVVADFAAMTHTAFVMQPASPNSEKTTLPSPVIVATAPTVITHKPQQPTRITPLPAPMPAKAIEVQPHVVTPAQPLPTIASTPSTTPVTTETSTPVTSTLETSPVKIVDKELTPTPITPPTTESTPAPVAPTTTVASAEKTTEPTKTTESTPPQTTITANTEKTENTEKATPVVPTTPIVNAEKTTESTKTTEPTPTQAITADSAKETVASNDTASSVEPPKEPRPASDKVTTVKDSSLPKHKITTEHYRTGWKVQIDVNNKDITREQCLALLNAYRDQAGSEGQVVVRKPSTLFGDPVQQPWCIDMLDGQNVVFNDYFF